MGAIMRNRREPSANSVGERRQKRDVVDEIKRNKSERWDTYLHLEPYQLKDIAARTTSDTDVILQLIPVRSVAIIEGFTRQAIAEFINKGAPYIGRAEYLFQSI
jgi:hypothetical protein